MSETRFVKFTEVNDWEGETWRHWLQVDGNELELGKLRKLLDAAEEEAGDGFPYSLAEDSIAEHEVDTLVEHGGHAGYMAAHNKVPGRFTCPDSLGEGAGELYKGQIADYFTQEASDA